MTRMRVGGGWPHAILQREPRNERIAIEVANARISKDERHAPLAFFHAGAVDADGMLTPAGRAAVIEGVREAAAALGVAACVVWGPRSCTWLGIRDVDGNEPPLGDPVAAAHGMPSAPVTVPGSWIELHPGCASSHVFLRRLSYDRVEISSAAPMRVGGRDAAGTLPVGAATGAVQPDGRLSIVTSPWPALVHGACCEIAGRTIPVAKLAAAWAAVADDRSHAIHTDVRRAA